MDKMKLEWCPKTAEISYLDTVKHLGMATEFSPAEFLSAMAGGWRANLIVEVCSSVDTMMMSSIGLAIAAHHTGGRHVCIVSDERSRIEFISSMKTSITSSSNLLPQVMVGDWEEMLSEKLIGIDFLVVDGERKDVGKIFCLAKLSHLGGVLVCRNTKPGRAVSRFRWNRVLGNSEENTRMVVRSLALPNGLDIAYVASVTAKSNKSSSSSTNCWIRHIDQQSGEEHVYRNR